MPLIHVVFLKVREKKGPTTECLWVLFHRAFKTSMRLTDADGIAHSVTFNNSQPRCTAQIKDDIWEKGNGKEELIKKFDGFKDMPILKELNAEAHVGPPVWADRAKGYNYAIFTRFASRADFETYRDHPQHIEFVTTVIRPNNSEPPMAYDWEV